jgi:hypothetical protein
MRIRITFAKTDALRYIGHLDLHKMWERVTRRAGLSLAYTPRQRSNLPPPCRWDSPPAVNWWTCGWKGKPTWPGFQVTFKKPFRPV